MCCSMWFEGFSCITHRLHGVVLWSGHSELDLLRSWCDRPPKMEMSVPVVPSAAFHMWHSTHRPREYVLLLHKLPQHKMVGGLSYFMWDIFYAISGALFYVNITWVLVESRIKINGNTSEWSPISQVKICPNTSFSELQITSSDEHCNESLEPFNSQAGRYRFFLLTI